MDEAKIRLSDAEMDLLKRADWILTKNHILKKSMLLLGMLQENYSRSLHAIDNPFMETILQAGSKISKGENLEGLPYQVLDYPRIFEQQDIFTIRTLFWWGNFFSITIQLSGKYQSAFSQNIAFAYSKWKENGFSICVNTDPWLHHFRNDNYEPVSIYSKEEFRMKIGKADFIKLAAKLEISRWDHSIDWLQEKFDWIVKLLSDQLPRR